MFPLAEIVAFDVTQQAQQAGPTAWTPAAVVWVTVSIIGAIAAVLIPSMISLTKAFAEARSATAKNDQLSLQVQTLEKKLNDLSLSIQAPAAASAPPPTLAAMLPDLAQAQLAQAQLTQAAGKEPPA